jgi:hypothetical protein
MQDESPIFISKAFFRRLVREKKKQEEAEKRAQERAQKKALKAMQQSEPLPSWDDIPDPPPARPLDDTPSGSYILDQLVGAVNGYVASGGEAPAFFYLDESGKIWLTADVGSGSSPVCGWQCKIDENGKYVLTVGQARLNFNTTVIPQGIDLTNASPPFSIYLTCSNAGVISLTTIYPGQSSLYVMVVDVNNDGLITHYTLGQTVDFVLVSDCPSQ